MLKNVFISDLDHCVLFLVILQEVIMMLEQSTRDFQSLIDRMQVQKAFENAKKDGDRYINGLTIPA